VNPIGEVAAHKTIPPAPIDIKLGGPGDKNPALVLIGIEESLKEILPAREFVKLVKCQYGKPLFRRTKLTCFGDGFWSSEYQLLVIAVVPVKIVVGQLLGHGCLSRLSRAAHE